MFAVFVVSPRFFFRGEGARELVASLLAHRRQPRRFRGLQKEDAGVKGRKPVPVAPQVLLALTVDVIYTGNTRSCPTEGPKKIGERG